MMNIIKLIYMYLSIHVPYFKLDISYVFAVYKIDANLKQQELSLLQHNRGIIFLWKGITAKSLCILLLF